MLPISSPTPSLAMKTNCCTTAHVSHGNRAVLRRVPCRMMRYGSFARPSTITKRDTSLCSHDYHRAVTLRNKYEAKNLWRKNLGLLNDRSSLAATNSPISLQWRLGAIGAWARKFSSPETIRRSRRQLCISPLERWRTAKGLIPYA